MTARQNHVDQLRLRIPDKIPRVLSSITLVLLRLLYQTSAQNVTHQQLSNAVARTLGATLTVGSPHTPLHSLSLYSRRPAVSAVNRGRRSRGRTWLPWTSPVAVASPASRHGAQSAHVPRPRRGASLRPRCGHQARDTMPPPPRRSDGRLQFTLIICYNLSQGKLSLTDRPLNWRAVNFRGTRVWCRADSLMAYSN